MKWFSKLYEDPLIKEAFDEIFIEKMRCEGYFDASPYIGHGITKKEMVVMLTKNDSVLSKLYKGAYADTGENTDGKSIISDWKKNSSEFGGELTTPLKDYESSAIVYWVFSAIKNKSERESFAKKILHEIKETQCISSKAKIKNGIVYNSDKVNISFVSKINEFHDFLIERLDTKGSFFYRGHENANYILKPSVMRTIQLQKNENKMYNELLIDCPKDFDSTRTYFEKLVKMQHYGLPTRMLDITRNPLVALYFACQEKNKAFGEVIIIHAQDDMIKYPQSDTASILSCFPTFSHEALNDIKKYAEESKDDGEFNSKAERLIQAIRIEKPAFQPHIEKKSLFGGFIVYALKNNERIIKQDGAFILCGFLDENSLQSFRYKDKNNDKKDIVLINHKEKQSILSELDIYSINKASLFPEIDHVSDHIKRKHGG